MNTQEQISAMETRQLELLAIMSSSDAHAAKCAKLSKKFSVQYPEEYAAYLAANEEYNANEGTLAALYIQRANEAEAENKNLEANE